MKRPKRYQTKTQQILLEYISSLEHTRFSAKDLIDYFTNSETTIGAATIYRQLDRMCEDGSLRRYTYGEEGGAYYQYLGESCISHYHLTCTQCGKLVHLECDLVDKMQQHIWQDHQFLIQPATTVFFGICLDCIKQSDNTLPKGEKSREKM